MPALHPDLPPTPDRAPRSRDLTVALVGIGLEVLLAVVGAVLLIIGLADVPGELLPMSLFLVVVALGLAAALALAGRSLARGSRRGRAPTITWQIFQVIVGVGAWQAGTPWIGIPLIALALVVAAAVLRTAAAAERSVDGERLDG